MPVALLYERLVSDVYAAAGSVQVVMSVHAGASHRRDAPPPHESCYGRKTCPIRCKKRVRAGAGPRPIRRCRLIFHCCVRVFLWRPIPPGHLLFVRDVPKILLATDCRDRARALRRAIAYLLSCSGLSAVPRRVPLADVPLARDKSREHATPREYFRMTNQTNAESRFGVKPMLDISHGYHYPCTHLPDPSQHRRVVRLCETHPHAIPK